MAHGVLSFSKGPSVVLDRVFRDDTVKPPKGLKRTASFLG